MTVRPSIVDPEEFRRARSIFESVLVRPPAERGAVVEEACGGDAHLLALVQAMLRADGEPHSLLDSGPMGHTVSWRPGDIVAGHFRIVSLLGRGGMGEVYRAHDLTLARDVALKVLPSSALPPAGLMDRLARFEREAQVLAALNHENIAAIYGVAQVDGARALVLELVEGQTLAECLEVGPIPLDDVISIARQIAIGLEAAHEQGVVHRDLKPSNISVRPNGTVKLLDFGLAKIVQPEGAVESAAITSPPITSPSMLQRGVVLGTAAYMSPEQAKGREVDRRSDVWAFGAILYEMLSGKRAFKGDDVAETLAAVIRGEVDSSQLPPSTPAALRQLVTRCLDRNVSRRLRDIGEARIVLEDLSTESTLLSASEEARPRRSWRGRLPIAAAVVAVLTAAAAVYVWWPRLPKTVPLVTRFELSTPADQTLLLDPLGRDLTITPDGRRVVYKGGARRDRTQLFVRALDQLAQQALTSPGQPKDPFASLDSQWIGFFEPNPAGAVLKKVSIAGGPPIPLTQLDAAPCGATWGDDDTIIAASTAPSTGLLRIPANGGEATVLTRPRHESGEGDHLWPRFLPGSRAVLYTITSMNGDINDAQVAVLDIASGTSKTVIRGASQAHYVTSGHLVYLAGGALWGIAFDLRRLETIGTAAVIVPRVVTLASGVAELDIARDGTLVYVAQGGSSEAPQTLVWVNRQGHEVPVSAPPRPYSSVALSPDATRVALEIKDQDNDIWVWDFAREALTRVTTNPGRDESPVWMPDGRRLVFTSESGPAIGSLFLQAADGSGVAERLTEGRQKSTGARPARATAALPGGSGILFADTTLKMLTLGAERRVTVLTGSRQISSAGVVSPDGRWLAYVVTDGRSPPQVFVSPFSNPDESRLPVSTDGGSQPRWSPDGRELLFIGSDGILMTAPIRIGATASVGVPTRVLKRAYYSPLSLTVQPHTYDVSPDGRRFLMLKPVGPDQPAEPARVIVVRNWVEELRQLVPTR